MEPRKLQQAIVAERGNLTRAATFLDVSKQCVMVAVRRLGLNEWARAVRIRHGFPPTGNPTSKPRRVSKKVGSIAP